MIFSKTVYIEIEADEEEEAEQRIAAYLLPLQESPDCDITYVDLEGPIEEC